MRHERVINSQLRALLTEAKWTGEALAQAVNALGVEVGLSLRYRRAAVSHWLSGMRPRPPVPDLVAEALSRRLNRSVTANATGLVTTHISEGLNVWWNADAAGGLVELSERSGATDWRPDTSTPMPRSRCLT